MSNREIVVIGGSAGANKPLRAILASLPAGLPATVLVVLHMPTRGIGLLASAAGVSCGLAVRQAADGMPVEPGHVYFAVPDRHLLVQDGCLLLGRGPRENLFRPAIDPLFRSVAVGYGSRVIGVVLSGMLSDGAAGLDAIARCGGTTVVQDPADAAEDEMPRRAIEATAVDFKVPAARLGEVVTELVGRPARPPRPIPPDLRLEVEIATGTRLGTGRLGGIAGPAALTCPSCGGVLSEMRKGGPLRFRCQVGHAYTADALALEQEDRVDEAMRIALRILEERVELVTRMAEDGRRAGRLAVAAMYEERAREYRDHAEAIRRAVMRSLGGPGMSEEPEQPG